jgi:hypothetical protein
MPSPFPGMNPYLEQEDQWHSFHEWFIPRLAEVLVGKTPSRYLVKLDESVYLHELSSEERRLLGRPDVMVLDGSGVASDPKSGAATAGLAPIYAKLPAVDLQKLSSIEIRDGHSRRLITAIELLIPMNKRLGPDRDVYLAKRARIMRQGVNLVEIDLLRGWPRMPMEGVPTCDYLIMVARPEEWPRAGVWPILLRQALPTIPIPLIPSDPDVKVDLQDLLNSTYDAGGFSRYIYDGEPEPALSPEDAEWARKLVPSAA